MKRAKGDALGGGKAKRRITNHVHTIDELAADMATVAWLSVVGGLSDIAFRPEVASVPTVRDFVWELHKIASTLRKEASPAAPLSDLMNRLSAGVPRAKERRRTWNTPLARAERWTREYFVEEGADFPTRIAFAEHFAALVKEEFGVTVDPQTTIVERWLTDL